MYFRGSGGSQLQLVENLMRQGVFSSERVKQILLAVDRADFTAVNPHADYPQRIGWGATISAPHMHASALQNLEPVLEGKKNASVLDVGSGSGYLTACLALMVGEKGKVYGIEHIEQLVDESQKNIRKNHADLLDSGQLIIMAGDGRQGYPTGAPYDAIHVGAAAEEMPKQLVNQLAIGGRMLIPVGMTGSQNFVQIDKVSETDIRQKVLGAVIYVPLTNKEQQLGGSRR